jgi:hypothetical protein
MVQYCRRYRESQHSKSNNFFRNYQKVSMVRAHYRALRTVANSSTLFRCDSLSVRCDHARPMTNSLSETRVTSSCSTGPGVVVVVVRSSERCSRTWEKPVRPTRSMLLNPKRFGMEASELLIKRPKTPLTVNAANK